jgi:hypothetical protein
LCLVVPSYRTFRTIQCLALHLDRDLAKNNFTPHKTSIWLYHVMLEIPGHRNTMFICSMGISGS